MYFQLGTTMNTRILSLLLLCTIMPLTAGRKKKHANQNRRILAQVGPQVREHISSISEDAGEQVASIGPWSSASMFDDDSEDEKEKSNYPSYPRIKIDTEWHTHFKSLNSPFQLYYFLCGLPLIKGLYKGEEIISEDNITFVNDHHTIVSRTNDGTVLVCNHHLRGVRPMYTVPIARTEGDHEETVKADGNYIIVTNKDGRRFKLNHAA